MSDVVLFAYPIKLNISKRNSVTKILYKRSHIVISSDLFNAAKKMPDKFSFYRHFKKKCSHFKKIFSYLYRFSLKPFS